MDLIYMNAAKEDVGVLQEYELDLAFGEDENNFECTTVASRHCCEAGYYLYMEGTEYGGVIDAIESDTGTEDVVYSGRTWHGIIGSKIIVPLQEGEKSTGGVEIRTEDSKGNSLVKRYLIISGDANSCIRFILDRIGVSDMFKAPESLSGVYINSYQFGRYVDAYMGIRKMLASAGLKMKMEYTNGKVTVSAVPRYDFSKDDSFNSDLVELKISKRYKTVNHLICLGKGELENRLVIHLYADADGNISQTQTQFGLDEYSATYDYSTIESEEELMAEGIDELKALWSQDELAMDFDESMDAYDVGDIVGGVDNITGVAAASTITKKIVTIKNGKVSIELSTDTVSQSGSGSTGNASGSGGGSGGGSGTVTSVANVLPDETGNVPLTATHVGALPASDTAADAAKLGGKTWAERLLDIYPVGSIYMSVSSTSPASLFGGTWEQLKDRFLLGAGGTYTAGATGGAATHKLTIAEMPYHNHPYLRAAMYYDEVTDDRSCLGEKETLTTATWRQTNHTGGDQPHNNMPPYLVVYMWKRVA